MNILNITSSFPLYDGHGAGPFVLEEARELASLGYQQIVLTQHYKGSSRHEFIGPVEVIRFGWLQPQYYTRIREMSDLRHLPHLLSYFFSAILSGRRIIRKQRINLIYAQWSLPSGLIGYILSRMTGLPLVVGVYGADVLGQKPLKFPFKNVNRMVFRNACKVLIRVDHLYERIVQTFGEEFSHKLVDIPVGLDIDELSGKKNCASVGDIKKKTECESRPVVLTVRNLSPNYQLENLLKAIKSFKDSPGDVRPRFIIVGGGTPKYTAKLKEMVNNLGILDWVHFTGPVEHKAIAGYLAACDIFVDPAIIGQGVACLEAMCLAKPAVGFRGGGAAQKIENGISGFLVDVTSPMDTACREMAHQIRVLLEDEALRRELGGIASLSVKQNYGWQNIAARIGSTLEDAALRPAPVHKQPVYSGNS